MAASHLADFIRGPMNKKIVQSFVAASLLTVVMVGCSSGSTKTEPDETPTSVVVPVTSTVADSRLSEVESNLASLDADLEVIDQAIADLDSIAR